MNGVPEKLLRARRQIDAIGHLELLEDWNRDHDVWFIKVRIRVDAPSEDIPKYTDWYAVVNNDYPYGKMKIYPAIQNSLTMTLPHQSDNASIASNKLWREGSLCTEVIDGIFSADDNNSDFCLAFHLRRAVLWLNAAATGTLTQQGDPYENPHFPTASNYCFVFSEDEVSYMQWEGVEATFGFAYGSLLRQDPPVFCVRTFKNSAEQTVHCVDWGTLLTDEAESNRCLLWIKLPKVPVLNIWQAPATIGQLIDVCKNQDVDIVEIIRHCVNKIRDNKQHLLLLGFPIPRNIGEENASYFWQALQLPVFSSSQKPPKGFRSKAGSMWLHESSLLLHPAKKIDWVDSQNWNDNEVTQRGKLREPLPRMKYAIIGCGCIGATIAELLVRAGVRHISIIDHDIVSIGNLSRHTLTVSEVEKSKAMAVKDRLNALNPHANVEAIAKKLVLNGKDELNINMSPYNVIIDCTGSDSVLHALSYGIFQNNSMFFSISIGLDANRIYMNVQNLKDFRYLCFLDDISEYMREEQKNAEMIRLPRDGIGCWHSTFPARSDDIWTVASIAVKTLERYCLWEQNQNTTLVFEKDKDVFTLGYRIIRRLEHG